MLVLLIIFMVTAPLLTAGVPVNLPDSRANPLDQDQQPVQIALDQSGRIFIDDAATGSEGLPARPQQIAAGVTGAHPPQIFLRADRPADFGRVVQRNTRRAVGWESR